MKSSKYCKKSIIKDINCLISIINVYEQDASGQVLGFGVRVFDKRRFALCSQQRATRGIGFMLRYVEEGMIDLKFLIVDIRHKAYKKTLFILSLGCLFM